jgi:hypothetical protein
LAAAAVAAVTLVAALATLVLVEAEALNLLALVLHPQH